MLTTLETQIILRLFKDISTKYNASTISKKVNATRIGAYKALKRLKHQNILISEQLGKADFYAINKSNDYAKKLVELLLMEETKQKWVDQFEELAKHTKSIVLFGSTLINEEKSKDIDLLIIMDEQENETINNLISQKNKLLLKNIHPLKQTVSDIKTNINDKVLQRAISTGIVLHGADQYVRMMLNVSN